MTTLQKFIEVIGKEKLFLPTDILLLAVSGGIDSVALCELCRQAGYRFQIAHVNFQLRGEESDRDEQFVKSLGDKFGCRVYVKRLDAAAYAEVNKLSVQVAAREIRYSWFSELVCTPGDNDMPQPKWTLTAHHAGDNIETLLMNFFRGTGIIGLRGMLPKQGNIIRPLLSFSRDELVAFAAANQLTWVEDSSNASEKYTRNYFRHTIIPLVNKIFPEAENNLLDNLERFRDLDIIYRQAMEKQIAKLLHIKGDEAQVPVLALKHSAALNSLVYELIKPYHFTSQQVKEVVHLLDAEQGKYVQSATHRIIRNRNWLIIASNVTENSAHILIEKHESSIAFKQGILILEEIKGSDIKADVGKNVAVLEAKMIRYPLVLRKWKTGDYFYPLGMRKKKKISRFLIDQKLSPTDKEKVWVVESNKKIIWVAGMRIDDRFRLTENTTSALMIKVK
ncbi:MAG: tRNA lysidine(34) synthetase TilS [Flavitalea sp.]